MGLYYNIALFLSFEEVPQKDVNVSCVAEIVGLKEEKTNLDKYTLKILECEEIKNCENKKFIVYVEKTLKYKAGDIVKLKGILQRADESRNFYGFNNRNYLKQNKIYGIIEIEKIEYIRTKRNFNYLLGKIQESLKEKIENLYGETYENVIGKILFGINGRGDNRVEESFRDSGIYHVLSISGMHISYIVFMMNFIFDKLIANIKLKNILICITLILFLVITGLTPSCIRSCIMSMMYLISQNCYRKNDIYISMLFAFSILIFFNIFVIYNVGMWLSFLGTLGIVLFYRFFSVIFKFKSKKKIFKVIDIVFVSFSAQILIWPVILYTFNTVSLTFFISNIFVSVLTCPIILLGYFSIICSYFFLPLAKIVVIFQQFLMDILFFIADICSKIPFSKIYIKGNNFYSIVFYYILICVCVFYFQKNKLYIFRMILLIKKGFCFRVLKENRKILILIIITVILFSSTLIFYNLNLSFNSLEIYLVDVGQGDCVIIKTGEKNIIIDSGEGNSDNKYDYGKNVVFQHLLKLGINKIDYMIFSHMDSDHAGGLIYILENMKVENVLIGIQSENSECFKSLMELVNKKDINLSILESGMKIKIDNDSYIDVLWPEKNNLILENGLNNNSLVFKFYYDRYSILFTGDIEETAEKQIVEKYKEVLKCDVLKVAHHGSKTSTISSFLEYASPKIALIGVGKDNKFGHPSEVIIKRLNNINCNIYRTDLYGETILKIKDKKISVITKLK